MFGSAGSLVLAGAVLGETGFTSVDIGAQRPAGETVVLPDGYDVTSATGDVWGYWDDYRFVYQRVVGNFDLRARIASLAGVAHWTKAGLMVREDLSEFAANGFMVATRSAGWGRYFFTGRLAAFYATYSYFQGSYEGVSYPNVWVRLVRVGTRVIPMHSNDGVVWAQIGDLEFASLPGVAYVGMAVSNHPESGSVKATAQFRDVSLDSGLPVAPAIISQPVSVTVNAGAEVRFSLFALGAGTLEFQWFRDGVAIEGATSVEYALPQVQAGDDAKFTCRVRNEAGEVLSWAAQLEVAPKEEPFDGIAAEIYSRIYGRMLAYLINDDRFPGVPAVTNRLSRFEVGVGTDRGVRLRGYLTPPQTGLYTFYIEADDRGELWLSTDDNPAHKRSVAWCYYWVNSHDWEAYSSQKSAPIRLQAGQRYYVEALFNGEEDPNHGAVAWRLPDGKLEGPIPATRFAAEPATLQDPGWIPASGFQARVAGSLHSLYRVETSADLFNWIPLTTSRAPFRFTDPEPPEAHRFYRAVSPR